MGDRKMREPFYALHAATLDPATTAEVLGVRLRAADAMQDRHRLSEGAVYMSAQRRWTMLTGTDWKATQQPEGADTWAESDHRLRVRPQVYPLTGWVWGCSCGTSDVADTREQAEAVHAAHAMTAGAS